MLAEYIMHKIGWTDVWYAHPGPLGFPLPRWHVGIWNDDLLCIKKVTTGEDAEQFLSPGSRTILGATIKAVLKKEGVEL